MEQDDQLPAALIGSLDAFGEVRSYPARAIVIRQGEQDISLYVVLRGRLRVSTMRENGRELVLNDVAEGEYFGELSLDGSPRSASVQAVEATQCRIIRDDELHRLLAERPEFARHVTLKLIRLVRRLTGQAISFALEDVYGRLVRVLMDLSDPADDETSEVRNMRIRLTQQELADRVGASREMVNRVMQQLVTGGYLTVGPNRKITIHKKLPADW